MRRSSSILVLGLAAALWAGPSRAAEEPSQVLEGRLIDLGCYLMDMRGAQHAACGLQCAQKGLPVGLLVEKAGKASLTGKVYQKGGPAWRLEEKSRKVYTVVLPSPGLALHVEKLVRITGKVREGNLLSPGSMEVQEGDTWRPVELPQAM